MDTGEARARGAWLFFFFFKGGGGRVCGEEVGSARGCGGKRSSCGAQMRDKRNQSPARAIKHSPRALFTGRRE